MKNLENLPYRETHRSVFIKHDFWNDDFKKSACQHYSSGWKYAYAVLRKNFNKPVDGLVYKLRNQTKSKHRSFKMAVEDVIERDLLTNSNWSYIAYVDEEGIVRDVETHPSYKNKFTPVLPKPDTKDIKKYLKVENGRTDYIMRVNGIHYFVDESYYQYSLLEEKQKFYSFSYWLKLKENLGKIDLVKFQLNTEQLVKYNLVNLVV